MDPVADVVTLTASVGAVVDNCNGGWNWSFNTRDGPDENQVITITATGSDGAKSTKGIERSLARPFLGWPGAILWLAMVGMGIPLVGVHWPELTENITDYILAPKNLFILWLTFPFLKLFHEFGHAFAVKIRGGEVHEMGIMFLVFTPIPYVDASAASAFTHKCIY